MEPSCAVGMEACAGAHHLGAGEPAKAQAACRRAPAACACRTWWAKVWRSFNRIIRPRPPEYRREFFESTNKAAVSANALSLRRISRSSSWMRRRSLRVSSGLARAPVGVASAAIACSRQGPEGYRPCSRHQALQAASSSAAVAITASRRAVAAQVRSVLGAPRASARQRSSVAMLITRS